MGYKRPGRTFLLKFSAPDMAGFECEMRSLSVGNLLKMTRLASEVASGKEEGAEELLRLFASRLVSWNLEDGGGPVPADFDGVATVEDLPFLMRVIMAWAEAVASVDTPLPEGSSNGRLSEEASLNLAASSRSLGS